MTSAGRLPILRGGGAKGAPLSQQDDKMELAARAQPHFRETADGMQLVATRQSATDAFQFPPAQFVHGASPEVQELLLDTHGLLYSYTIVHLGRDTPAYALAMVDFEGGLRVFGRWVHESDRAPRIGERVKTVACALKDGTPDYAFSPV